ncbi:MAG: winged helix DNA-binding domain-containing protein [Gemmatimonadota bacterium]
MPLISNQERRLRLVRRHHLGATAPDAARAAADLVALHSTDPVTPYLSLRARVAGFAREDLDDALLSERSLLRLHAMRRTLFVVPTEDASVFQGAAAREIAERERRRVEGWLVAESKGNAGEWLRSLEVKVMEELAHEGELLTRDLPPRVEGLDTRITLGSGKWTSRVPLSSRLLFLLAMEGRIVRTRPAGSWRSSQYRWAAVSRWLDIPRIEALPPADARAELLHRYLARFGPATLEDVRWWTGWTVARARAAVTKVGAVEVKLEEGGRGMVLPGDEAEESGGFELPVVALLPALDPTIMGWKARNWYLGSHADALFDRNGNAGPTIWVDGRVVGGWGCLPSGGVGYRLLESVGREAERAVAEEAAALTSWLAGEVVLPRFRTPLEKELAG